MRLLELSESDPQNLKLLALSRFLLGRSQDTRAEKTISLATFLSLAHNMEIAITADSLKSLAQTAPLNSVIANVEGDAESGRVTFKGADQEVTDTMSVDQARDTVDKMAKRALD